MYFYFQATESLEVVINEVVNLLHVHIDVNVKCQLHYRHASLMLNFTWSATL